MVFRPDVNNKAKKYLTDVHMFASGQLFKLGDAFKEQTNVMIRRKVPTLCIDLVHIVHCFDPGDKIFDNTLQELMEYIGHDQMEDIWVEQILLKWLVH